MGTAIAIPPASDGTWDPREVMALKSVDRRKWPLLGDQWGEQIPMADLSQRRLALGQKASLNSGWKVQTDGPDGPMWLVWQRLKADASLTWPERMDRYLEVLFAKQDEMFHPVMLPFVWSDLEIAALNWYAHPVDAWLPAELRTDWLNRSYQHGGTRFRRIYWHHSGGYFCDGHGAYLGVCNGAEFTDSLFDELGGNGIQLTAREGEFKAYVDDDGKLAYEPKIDQRRVVDDPKPIIVARNVFGETGYADGRGSYPISIMSVGKPGREVDVFIDDNWIACRWAQPGSKGHYSRGGILVEGTFTGGWAYGSVRVTGFTSNLWRPDRQILAINNAREVEVTGNRFWAHDGGTNIDYDRLDFPGFASVKTCGKIHHYGNDGNVPVRLRDKIVGMAADDITIERGAVTKIVKAATLVAMDA